MKPGKIRAITLCVFLHEGKLLVGEGFDKIKQQSFGRPLCGTIEFGESSQDTIVREIREEVGRDFTQGHMPLYPTGLLEIIQKEE